MIARTRAGAADLVAGRIFVDEHAMGDVAQRVPLVAASPMRFPHAVTGRASISDKDAAETVAGDNVGGAGDHTPMMLLLAPPGCTLR